MTVSAALGELLDQVRDAVAAEPGPAAAYVYGSVARGQASALSDLDVAVVVPRELAEEGRAALQRRLITVLERRLPGRRVEVRFLDELPIAVRARVVQEGVRVLDRDQPLRVRQEVQTRMEYHDFLYFERTGLAEGLRGLRRKIGGG